MIFNFDPPEPDNATSDYSSLNQLILDLWWEEGWHDKQPSLAEIIAALEKAYEIGQHDEIESSYRSGNRLHL